MRPESDEFLGTFCGTSTWADRNGLGHVGYVAPRDLSKPSRILPPSLLPSYKCVHSVHMCVKRARFTVIDLFIQVSIIMANWQELFCGNHAYTIHIYYVERQNAMDFG